MQFRYEHEEGKAFSLPKHLFGQSFDAPVVGRTYPQRWLALLDIRDLPRLKSRPCERSRRNRLASPDRQRREVCSVTVGPEHAAVPDDRDGNGFSRVIRICSGHRVLAHIKELGEPNDITHVGVSDRSQFGAKHGWWDQQQRGESIGFGFHSAPPILLL